MTYHHFSYGVDGGSMFPRQSLSYYGTDTDNTQRGVFHGPIDPSLEASGCSLGQSQTHCSVPQMERYLLEQQSHLFQAPQTHSMQTIPFATLNPDMMPLLPPRSQGRRGSPFSPRHSSAASGAQSPRTESDACYDSTQGPTTPSDMAVMSPYVASISYDHWESNPSQFSLAGISYAPSGGCVNPCEINPSQDALMERIGAEPAMEFSLQRGSSFDSETSSQFQEASFSQTGFYHPMSPEPSHPAIKQEIHVKPTQAPIYPDPENIDDDVTSPGEIVVQPHRSHHDDDEDYKPGSRIRSPRDQKIIPRRTRQKRSSMSTLTEKPRVLKQTVSSGDTGRRLLSSMSGNPKTCSECRHSFKDETALQKHVKTQHTRPFICVFHFAGCDSTFATKNEWKRHVLAQHLALYYWLCDNEGCGQAGSQCQKSESSTHGRPFRRKDLFTQHARRMHLPETARKLGKAKNPPPEWEDKLKTMQEDALRQRCKLPTYMRCPAENCTKEFHGENAWDNRMEHVARHLERAASEGEPKMQFGGPGDATLMSWATSDSVKIIRGNDSGWEICSPLKDADLGGTARNRSETRADKDAEGEECF